MIRFVVLGASGSGKTTLTQRIQELNSEVGCLRFGDYLEAQSGVSREQVRKKGGDLLTPDVVGRAISDIRGDLISDQHPITLVECRNVAVRDYGFYVGMYSRRIMEGFQCTGVVYVDVSPELLEQRTLGDPIKRPWRADIASSLLAWERTAALELANMHQCPLYSLSGSAPLDEIAMSALQLVANV